VDVRPAAGGALGARIARALNEAGIPCPSAADPDRNPHRTAAAWTLGTVTTILGNPRYTGRQVWNRQRTDSELADPANTSLGHKQVQRWNLPDGWVISDRPAHPALVSEADFIAAQDISAARDLVLALSDDIVVRQRLGNHAPWPAMQGMPRSDFSPQFRYQQQPPWALHLDACKSATSLGERAGRRTQGLPRMLPGPSGGPARQPGTT
jgi:hypothetical protein